MQKGGNMSSSRPLKGIWSVLISLAFISSVCIAATERSEMVQPGQQINTGSTAPTDIPGRAGDLQSAKKAIGMRVENLQGERLGSIHDLVINQERDRVTYALVSEGLLERNRLHPVPWEAFGSGLKTYTLDITKDSLAGAPFIGSSEIDRLNSPEMKRQLGDFYSKQLSYNEGLGERAVGWIKEKGEQAFGSDKAGLYKCSTVLGTEIRNTEGTKIARLGDIVFDVREGKIDYGLASFGGMLGIGYKTAAVPWSAIALNVPGEVATLNADKSMLDSAVLARGDINRLNEPMFASRINDTFGREPTGHVYGYVAPKEERESSTSAWLKGSEYNNLFNPNTITTIEGTVKSVGTFTPEKGSIEGLKLKVETTTGETMVIHAGPESYYLSRDVRFNEGDKVSITGSKVKMGFFKDVIMASKITRGSDRLEFRDDSGRPLWKTEMMEKPAE